MDYEGSSPLISALNGEMIIAGVGCKNEIATTSALTSCFTRCDAFGTCFCIRVIIGGIARLLLRSGLGRLRIFHRLRGRFHHRMRCGCRLRFGRGSRSGLRLLEIGGRLWSGLGSRGWSRLRGGLRRFFRRGLWSGGRRGRGPGIGLAERWFVEGIHGSQVHLHHRRQFRRMDQSRKRDSRAE